jgi:hypothetical protein
VYITDRDWIPLPILLCAGYEVSAHIYDEGIFYMASSLLQTSLTARAGVSGRRIEKWIRMARSFKRNPRGLHILQIDLSAAYNVSDLAHVITTDVMPLTPCVTQPRVFVGFASGVSKPRGDRERLYSLSCRQENAEPPCEKG